MAKILKKYTTIPSHLYVHRDADKQLKNIIDEMERPGYVLVARQMGKTNLLLNAKREFEDSEHLFAYIDLSTVFEHQRDCYRNIINMIIEPNYSIFEEIANSIYEKREDTKLPPNIEYIQELKEILRVFKGKLIIILDEIDALTSADYSDQIFAQIRSNYFASRTNFPEFNNLTYVLSGVIEPTELIKDKNKSPFNIGEKIYLDDFSIQEHKDFIQKSKMDLSDDIIEYVYSWTNGNPRLNFEICSKVEDFFINNQKILKQDIDNVIKKTYLTNFDIAPIDHIREIVKDNKAIRNAVVQLQYGVSALSDDIKDKLYLAGIINADFSHENIKIKNKIISESLSLEWINSIEEQIEDLFEVGYKLILNNKNYKKGIDTLLKFLDNNSKKSETQIELSHYYIGVAYYQLKEYEKSNAHLFKQPITLDTSPDLHYRQLMFIGQNYIALSEPNESFKYFKEIVDNYKKGEPYLYSAITYGINLMLADFEKHHEYSLELFSDLLERVDIITDEGLDEDKKAHLKTLAYFYSSEIYLKNEDINKAIEYHNYAQKYAAVENMPYFKYLEFILNEQKDRSVIIDTANIIINNNLKFKEIQEFPFDFTKVKLYQILQKLIAIDEIEYFIKLIDYSINSLFGDNITKYQILLDIGMSSSEKEVANKIYKQILTDRDNIKEKSLLKEVYKQLSITNYDSNSFQSYFMPYYDEFDGKTISIDDLTAFAYAIRHYSGKGQSTKALEIGNKIEKFLYKLDGKLKFDSLVIYFWITNTYHSLRDKDNSLKYSNITLQLIEEAKTNGNKLSLLNEEGITTIKKQMEQVIRIYTPNTPVQRANKIGRNDYVTVRYFVNNLEQKGKYKRFIPDINAGKCEIIKST